MSKGYDKVTAVRYLQVADPQLRAHIDAVGPCTLTPTPDTGPHTLFDRLASSIMSQQLSVKAAATIAGRLRERAMSDTQLDPDRVAALSDEELRACGISRPKVAALRDLADAVRVGRIPTLAELRDYDDDEVITSLTTVRGIGRWTAEMLLIFLLDRPDVFPVADVGVRRGFERVLGLDTTASPAMMLERSASWAPYRSVASWYLWRAVDQTGESAPAPTSST
ncbi:DNA-3-methyladenine glycosylase [Dietzia sp. ANT_WB102]|uniref:DNA-3-methyladenine glycosylase family protein n=1 Tax=Dietzia sp. ANT_WB102 TaxID=2597345 RepID=UPI0011EC6960|nr:DNA-3-methyladenine glycosylase [Dietzia sp. ANT_WB102]KAA0918562.1 DNA-3-methyladenine glycosylase 2 family protein [Dietzia sp. ANT_WB102]